VRPTDYKIYIGGEFRETENTLNIINPFDHSLVAQTYLGSARDLDDAIIKAQKCMDELRLLPSFKKHSILNQIADQLQMKKFQLVEVLSKESGKPYKYATGEIERAIQTFRVAAEESRRLPGEYLDIDWTPAGEGKEGIVKYFPVGIVAGISPFNFPMNLAVHKIAPAIAAGCPIILKPSSSTPLSTLELSRVIDMTELPKGAVSILPMDRETGNQLVTDPRIKLLTFTGSPEVGWKMKEQAGKKKVVLELGGNAGVIVSDSADVENAVKKCIVGAFAYSGQVCIHAQRIFVQKQVFDQFIRQFNQHVSELKTGNPLDPETDISVMIDEDNAKRVEQWVQEALDSGAELVTGGKRRNSFYEPTVLTRTNSDMKVCALEIFGPVVTIERYDDFDQAMEEVNAGRYGLQAGVFTNRLVEMNMAFQRLDVGGVIINDVPTFRVDHMPYGGIKDSGLGREGVKYAIHDMMEPKILVKDK
jgi:glyceraldehyde-3-phosphate dehydrogenase (NADP+)